MTKSSNFQKYCEKAIEKITDEDIEAFKATTREEERIKIVYKYAKNIPIIPTDTGKSYDKAQHEKEKGNKFFATKKYKEALNSYNKGIIMCPQETGIVNL